MISGTPSLFVWSLSEQRLVGIESFVEQYTRDVTFYGSGKAALRDGLASLAEAGENVLVPAYLPDAVVEPFHELGLESRYYAVQGNLAPDLADLERRLDDDTVAVMSVNYFGFPQPGLEEFTSLVAEYDCYHVDDNAHAPLSVDDGTLLGTRGDLGFTSLWKLLPVPDGAMLYCNTDDVRERFEPSSLAGIRDGLDAADCRYVLKSIASDVLNSNARVRQSVDSFVSGRGTTSSGSSPQERYEAGKHRMSKLSSYVVEDADPKSIRAARRENYLAWREVFAERDDVEIVRESLPDGICPQVFPVRAREPQRLLAELERWGVGGAHTWPQLSDAVRTDPAYETATRLSREIVVLPVHQHLERSSIESIGERVRR